MNNRERAEMQDDADNQRAIAEQRRYRSWREWHDKALPRCTDRATLLNFLRDLATMRDPEAAHGAADDALLVYINDPEITAAFAAIRKYYI